MPSSLELVSKLGYMVKGIKVADGIKVVHQLALKYGSPRLSWPIKEQYPLNVEEGVRISVMLCEKDSAGLFWLKMEEASSQGKHIQPLEPGSGKGTDSPRASRRNASLPTP